MHAYLSTMGVAGCYTSNLCAACRRMFTNFLTYVRSWKLEMLDYVEKIRSDPSYEQRLMFALVDLVDNGS